MKLVIRNGRAVDPKNKIDKKVDILIEDGKIVKIGESPKFRPGDVTRSTITIDATGKVVTPGLIDMHTHLREPGREDEETIASGTRAAAQGGFTSICCMPNTQPVVDSVSGVKFILTTASQEGIVNVYPVGSITKGRKGEELAEIGKMRIAGIVGISDDGKPVMNAQIMRRALEYAKMFNLPVISHCEDLNLSTGGVMNEGFTSTVLGLKGIPRQAEEIMVARDIALAELTGGKLHLAHITTRGSVELVRQAKKKRIKVTCETAPHYFSLSEEDVRGYDTNTKINPPLRTKDDIEALCEGLADGTIDCIVSDHAPHLDVEKDLEYNMAPFGIIGLETMVPLIITNLVGKKILNLNQAIAKMTVNPANILGLEKGALSIGSDADLTIIDLNLKKKIDNEFSSQSKNSPFIGMELKGFPVATIVGGKMVMEDGKLV
ncbi:amidohydrolase family protein [bacterium]|nr:amidohydrolase family protein [bacterium]NIN92828.1 amidohydrolase family protein [bacterium]NIO18783.1 amidohydrolase family protein [bacterium]NIO73864.1 amidohydrolase family protein [bacterium]